VTGFVTNKLPFFDEDIENYREETVFILSFGSNK
jgi:hypothetical protein